MEKIPEIKIFKKDKLHEINNSYMNDHRLKINKERDDKDEIVNDIQIDINNVIESDNTDLIKELETLSDNSVNQQVNAIENSEKTDDCNRFIINKCNTCFYRLRMGLIYVLGSVARLYKYLRTNKNKERNN